MKTTKHKLIINCLILGFAFAAPAGTRLCYVQSGDSEGYKNVLAQMQISTNDYENHILYQEGDTVYTVLQSENSNIVQLATFNSKDRSTLVTVLSNGVDGITLINEPIKRLITCSAINK